MSVFNISTWQREKLESKGNQKPISMNTDVNDNTAFILKPTR